MVSSMVVVVESCRHMVVEETCSLPLVMGSSMEVVVGNCRHMVVEVICTQPLEM
ncbi:unnamed protein product, partial [Eruca vesicaria subsp. sativa]|nr:unnamed protein product [Eruca vesicaria subsp. sativa]